MLPLVLSSDSHVFEPPDLWQPRISEGVQRSCTAGIADRRADRIMDWANQILSGIGLISRPATSLTFYGFASRNSNLVFPNS